MKIPWYLMAKGKGGGYKTASGPIVSVNDALAAPLRSLRVGIDPVQDLHGYDAPWPSGGGANKANLETATVRNDGLYGMSVTIDKTAETITMSGTWTGAAAQSWRFLNTPDIDTSLSIKAFELTSGPHIASVTQDGEENRLIIQASNMVSGTAYTIKFKLFAYSGTAPTSWAPYSNLCPISGWTEANLWRTGKNLLDDSVKSLYGNQICIGGQGEALLYNNVSVHLKAGTYTLSVITDDGTSPSGIYMGYTGESGYKAVSYSGGKLTFTITEERDIVVWAYKDGYGSVGASAVKSAQIELGSTPTTYAPYTGNQFTIQLGQTVYGGTLDVINGVLTVDRVVLSKKWSEGASSGTVTDIQRKAYYPSDGGDLTQRSLFRCNVCGVVSSYGVIGFLPVSSTQFYVTLPADTDGDTVIQMYYPLATPITIPLTPTEIATLQGQNTLWADTGDSTVEYLSAGGANPDLMKLAVAFMGRK